MVLPNTVLMHSLRQIRVLCGTQQVSSQRALTESVDISDDLSPWKASFSFRLFLEKQICIVLRECRCIHLLLVLPSKLAVSVCCQTVLLWAPSVLCVHSSACGKHSVYLASGGPHCKIPSQNVPVFKAAQDSGCCFGKGNGAEQEPWPQRKQVVSSCTVQGLQPHPSLLSLDVPELQMNLMLQINLNCK